MFFTRVLGHLYKHHTDILAGGRKVQSPDKYWTRRRVKLMAGHYYGRQRNCYRLSLNYLTKNLLHATKSRATNRQDFRALCEQRIEV